MDRYSLRDAQDHLKQLIHDAQHGKTVLILDEDERAIQLVPGSKTQIPRKAGSARGMVKMAADFDAPLADFKEPLI